MRRVVLAVALAVFACGGSEVLKKPASPAFAERFAASGYDSVGVWEVLRTTDPLTDSVTIWAIARGSRHKLGQAQITFSCDSGRVEARLDWGEGVDLMFSTVKWRLDSLPVGVGLWGSDPGWYATTWKGDIRDLIDTLATARILSARVEGTLGYTGPSVSIPLDSVKAATGPLLAQCRVPIKPR